MSKAKADMLNLEGLLHQRVAVTKTTVPTGKFEGVVVGYGVFTGKHVVYFVDDNGILNGQYLTEASVTLLKQGNDARG